MTNYLNRGFYIKNPNEDIRRKAIVLAHKGGYVYANVIARGDKVIAGVRKNPGLDIVATQVEVTDIDFRDTEALCSALNL